MRFHDLFDKGIAIDLLELDLRHLVEEHTYQGIAVGVKTIRCECQHCIAFTDRRSVDDFLSLTDSRDAGGEDVNAGIYNGRLDGSLAADKRALVLTARVGNSLNECADRCFLRLALQRCTRA